MAITLGFKIASGINNTANLKFFHELSPPLFARYKDNEAVKTEFSDVQDQEMDGDRDWIDIGLPSVLVTLFRANRAEYNYLRANFSGAVTIRALKQGENSYANFNAKLKPIRAGKTGTWAADAIGGFIDVVLECYDLEAL